MERAVDIIITPHGVPCSACGWPVEIAGGLCCCCRANVEMTDWLSKKIILTAGYARANFSSFATRVRDMQAVVIDIRFSPWSSMKEWRGEEMQRALGEQYLHVKALGNKNYNERERGIEIVNLNAGIDQALMIERPVVLFCGCPLYRDCHRRLVAEAITERGCFVQEWNLQQEAHFNAPSRGRLRLAAATSVNWGETD